MAKSKVLVVGATGYIGRRIVKASLEQGHITYVLQRPEIGLDIEKLQMLLSFKKQGARLVQASFSDHRSLVEAIKQVDVVICTMSGVHFRSHNILLQLKLVEAIKDAGNVKAHLDSGLTHLIKGNASNLKDDFRQIVSSKENTSNLKEVSILKEIPNLETPLERFLPSEFGMDPARMEDALEPGRETFDEKMKVRKAIEETNIPFTYVIANCFAGYFVGNLSQFTTLTPPTQFLSLYGDGNVKAIYMDEDDVATYTIKTIDDPRTLNKTLYLAPPENIISQRQLVEKWEKLIGRELEKSSISRQQFLAIVEGMDYAMKAGLGHFYHVFYDGCLTNFEIEKEGEEASKLYPEVKYTRMEEYLKLYL